MVGVCPKEANCSIARVRWTSSLTAAACRALRVTRWRLLCWPTACRCWRAASSTTARAAQWRPAGRSPMPLWDCRRPGLSPMCWPPRSPCSRACARTVSGPGLRWAGTSWPAPSCSPRGCPQAFTTRPSSRLPGPGPGSSGRCGMQPVWADCLGPTPRTRTGRAQPAAICAVLPMPMCSSSVPVWPACGPPGRWPKQARA